MSRRWDEREHPRDPGGRFTDGGGGWAQQVANNLVGKSRDLLGVLDQDDFEAMQRRRDQWREDGRPGDGMQDAIFERQGYHQPPRVVDESELDRSIARGGVELWRGVNGYELHGRYVSPAQAAEQFRTGPAHFPGLGLYGSGSYAATSRSVGEGYLDPDDANETGLIRMVLSPDARVATPTQLDAIWQDRLDRGAGEAETDVLQDRGRLAAIAGFDAIRVLVGYPDDWYYVILNRGALEVAK